MMEAGKERVFKTMQTWRLKFKHEKCFINYLAQHFNEVNTSFIFKVRNLEGKGEKIRQMSERY